MTRREEWARRAQAWMDRRGLTCDHLIGARFSVNVFLAGTIVWTTLRRIDDSNPIWAIASMVAACDPQPEEATRMFRSRLINVLIGCAVGFGLLVLGGGDWMIPVGLAVAVAVSSYVVRVKVMWRQAPITAAIVLAGGIASESRLAGIGHGLHKVAEVVFGCLVGLGVSYLMSKVWLIRTPPAKA
jgi:uncharacterized membrane protein YccC